LASVLAQTTFSAFYVLKWESKMATKSKMAHKDEKIKKIAAKWPFSIYKLFKRFVCPTIVYKTIEFEYLESKMS
jgi:hypothetical protein